MPGTSLLVLGAGPAGVATAQRAARAGHDVTVLERAGVVGGTSASYEVAGVRVDHGSHRLHRATDPAVLAELERLLGDDLQVRERDGRIRLAGRWLGFPLRPVDLVRNLPPGFAARALFDTLTAPLRRPRADTYDEVVRARLGPTMLERFYGPYAVKLWGLEGSELAGEQARRRITADTPWKLLRRVLAGTDPQARTFRYPRRGFGQLWEALADDAVAAGARIELGAEVTAVRDRGDGLEVTADGRVHHAPLVASTLPLPLLARLWDPSPPADVLAAARGLRTRAVVLVHLVVDRPRATRFDAHYLPEAWTPVTRISEPRNYRDEGERCGPTVLTAEVPCDVGDDLWRADDATLAALATEAWTRSDLPALDVVDVVTRRVASAYPVLTPDALPRVATLEAWAMTQPGLLTFGRQGLFVHDNSHHAMSMAWAAVDALRDDGVDRARWAASREGFRSHVVED